MTASPPLYTALDNESHVRTANLELKKARGILAPIRIPANVSEHSFEENNFVL
jgi:hypothetical protein